MSNQGFDRNSGPGTGNTKQQPSFGYRPPSQSPSPWFNASSQKPEVHQIPAIQPLIPSRNPRTESPAKNQVQDLKRTRSPPLLPTYKDILQNSRTVVRRPSVSVSPPRTTTKPNTYTNPGNQIWSSQSQYTDLDKPETPAINPSDFPVPKRSRLPSSTPNDPVLDDSERELQAKAKRLARFKDELSQPESTDKIQKVQQVDQIVTDKRKFMFEPSDMTRNSNLQMDSEDQDSSSTVIIGVCPDMCPGQERAERERKGDLDQYERLDGDRNQTTESLAVKKYTRTAEREATLIRPMTILQKTMDYLLNLLNQPYDERFLGLYNFLWDRMRAIRMDLRMQHIFNLGAITMLEQMIRLHIIAMHELCQYTKGEGFSEGFDAHLNIEQMNKTSVELFQLYDDHRKKGIKVVTEREFRGYYALLKLDKHPGYKVEPSELSLDLAKMTPGIRQTQEVLFARNVARACRTGNYIAFFRLVRKASYLQACLMHAHFGKLRTQALASLHSGLQNNQGIPVSQISKWLGLEEENMEDLLEYHGFFIKEFEEPYMVKEGQFLNIDNEYPLKCSKLVHMKRSKTVVKDVLSSPMKLPLEVPKRVLVNSTSIKVNPPVSPKKTKVIDTNMAVKVDTKQPPVFPIPVVERRNDDFRRVDSPRNIFKTVGKANSPNGSPKAVTTSVAKPSFDKRFRSSLEKHVPPNVPSMPPQVPPMDRLESMVDPVSVEDSMVDPVFVEDRELEEPENVTEKVPDEIEIEIDNSIDEEVAEAKLKLILRLWKRRAFMKKDLREKKQLVANAALSSLSLGPPMWHHKEQSKIHGNFNIDVAMLERYKKQEQLWLPLNVSNVVGPTLGERNRHAKVICWKLLFCPSDVNQEKPDPNSWLRHKLMPECTDKNEDLIVSFPDLSIWKKSDYRKSSSDPTCYLSVVKNVNLDNLLEESVSGASAVIFLASECVPWDSQRTRLYTLISSIPYGSRLPLLIVSYSSENHSKIADKLGLDELDKSRISLFSVLSGCFMTDKDLRMGLEWLASESPLQPVVHRVKTRDLIMKNLKILTDLEINSETSPQHCVSVVNRAVDESIAEIGNAAKSNPVNWPCPEISLLNGPDFRILEPYIPSIGWSSGSRVDPLVQVLRDCKLPNPDRVSCRKWTDIESQQAELERFLVGYLGPLIGPPLAQKEASALIQTCVGLELDGLTYFLVPNWVMIFQRVFNWRLMSISNGPYSSAYILSDQDSSIFDLESFEGESRNVTGPSLDEMIEVSCLVPRSESEFRTSKSESELRAPRSESELWAQRSESEFQAPRSESQFRAPRSESELRAPMSESESGYRDLEWTVNGEDLMEVEKEKESERSLRRLLEKCNIVQDMIDKKLSIYF